MKKVLFVCLGNICRSPAAEGIFIEMLKKEGLVNKVQVDSAGTSAYHAGEPADHRMQEHAQRRGYPLPSKSRQIRFPEDFLRFDFILAMDKSNLSNLKALDASADYHDKIKLITDYRKDMDWDHVPDPYFGGDSGFELVLDILEESCREFLHKEFLTK